MLNFFRRQTQKDKPFYITTTLPYVNAKLHVGHIMEFIRTDSVARYNRMRYQFANNLPIDSSKCENVFFNTGTDEHGIKIYQKAVEMGLDPQSFVDNQVKNVHESIQKLNISNDKFIRTTDADHIKSAQEFWTKCQSAGYIYKKNYSGLYCVGCEMFINEKDLINGECEYHPGKKLEKVEEENYFFAYSKLAPKLLNLYKQKIVIPDARLNEIKKMVENGLEDFSISRLKSKMPWGIPVPGDDEHVMYVWFDALVNYISTLGWPNETENFEKFWKNGITVQYCGKDNLQFQAARWQAMLLSVGLPTTDKIIINGFITSQGQKMSKTVGNVINPLEYVEKYGSESVRYFCVRELHPFEDSDFTETKFIETYNSHLANGLGNVVSRVLKMAENNNLKISAEEIKLIEKSFWTKESANYHKFFAEFNLQQASNEVWKIVGEIDAEITKTEPFKLIKTDKEKAEQIILRLVRKIIELNILLEPFMPETAKKIRTAVVLGQKPEALFIRK